MKKIVDIQLANSEEVDMWYPSRVWAMDIFIISPLVFLITVNIFSYPQIFSSYNLIRILTLVATFLSLPTLVATYITFRLSIYINASWPMFQVLCCIVANIGVGLTFWLTGWPLVPAILKMYFIGTNISFLISFLRPVQFLKQKLDGLFNH